MNTSFGGLLPKPEGLGIIKALNELAGVMRKSSDNVEVMQFDAGLPFHERPEEVRKAFKEYAEVLVAGYSRYAEGGIKESDVLPSCAEYHTRVTQVATDTSRLVLGEGSTPLLNHLIRMLPLQKAKQDHKELGENCMLETFELSYPLYEVPASHVNMTRANGRVRATIKLDRAPHIKEGEAITSEPWQLNRASLHESFAATRENVTTFVFSNPANPSGYVLSEDEMDFMASELLADYQYRTAHGIPAKLVIEDIAYITMMHDKNQKPYLLVSAFDKLIAAEAAKPQPDEALLAQMRACRETIVTADSLSKAKAVSGDRVAYAEGNPALINALREAYTQDMLSYSNAGLIAAKAAFESTASDEKVMQEYSDRVIALEEGMSDAYYNVVAKAGLQLTEEQIAGTMPFPNKASGTFFTIMNLKPLLGQKVDEKTIAAIHDYIGRIDNEGIRNTFGTIFENGTINDGKDLTLYFMFKTLEYGGTAVSTVPMSDGNVRFSVGMTKTEDVNRAVAAATAFFENDPAYVRGIAAYKATAPETTIQPKFTVDVSHFHEHGAIARGVN